MLEPAGHIYALAARPPALGHDIVFFLPADCIHLPLGINGGIQREDHRMFHAPMKSGKRAGGKRKVGRALAPVPVDDACRIGCDGPMNEAEGGDDLS
jgi:hypothetical protein